MGLKMNFQVFLAVVLYSTITVTGSFFPSESEEDSPALKRHKDNMMMESITSPDTRNFTSEAVDAIVAATRSGRQLGSENEKLTQVATDPEVRVKLESGSEVEARNFIRDKLCSLGLCDRPIGNGGGKYGHGPGIPPQDVTLVQPVALKPVGGPVHAVPLEPHFHRPGKAIGAGFERPGFGAGYEKPFGRPGPGPAPGVFPGSFNSGPPKYGHKGPFNRPPPQFGIGSNAGLNRPPSHFGHRPTIQKPILPPYVPGVPKPINTHVHHHVHHTPHASIHSGYNDGYYGAAQKPSVSVTSPHGKGLGTFQESPPSNLPSYSQESCLCIPADQCYHEPLGTQPNQVIVGTGTPNSGFVGFGIDPRNLKGASILSNDTEESTTSETSQKTQRRRRDTKEEMIEPRQLNYDGNSAFANCPRGYVCCDQKRTSQPIASSFGRLDARILPTSYGKCGVRQSNGINGRVISGGPYKLVGNGETEFGEFPWQTAILKQDGTFVCGGAVVDATHVITAAHCVKRLQPHELKVRMGEWDVNHETEFYPFIQKPVVSIVIHPDYYAGNLVNDVAILKFADFADFRQNPHISPICTPTPSMDFTGQRCFVTGWGKDAFGKGGKYQNVLKKVDLPILSHFDCEQKLKRTRLGPDFVLHSGFLCAGGEEGKDACKGDGGELKKSNRCQNFH